MSKKEIIARVRSDIKKHQKGTLDRMPTITQYAKLSEMTVEAMTTLLLCLTESEQAYCYNNEDNSKD